ncbi:phosphotransferase system, phosphocarrier protein HPr [Lachnospiraceae bacterium KM106-2]|nr:phosphotransferase system, phosphocarrier protein HPr [Lachnospiraceae bacterium KM106-2]
MKQFNFTIKDPAGIHARPAGELIKVAKNYESTITIKKGDKSAAADRIFGIMGLAAKQNDELVIEINGADEDKAYEGLVEFFNNNL